MEIKVKDIINICNGKLIIGDENIVCDNFSKDTRTIEENDVYIGIKGENFDGNILYENAFEKGAKVCILQGVDIGDEIKNKYIDRAIMIVEDTIKALQQIASYKRDLYDIPVIAITGLEVNQYPNSISPTTFIPDFSAKETYLLNMLMAGDITIKSNSKIFFLLSLFKYPPPLILWDLS